MTNADHLRAVADAFEAWERARNHAGACLNDLARALDQAGVVGTALRPHVLPYRELSLYGLAPDPAPAWIAAEIARPEFTITVPPEMTAQVRHTPGSIVAVADQDARVEELVAELTRDDPTPAQALAAAAELVATADEPPAPLDLNQPMTPPAFARLLGLPIESVRYAMRSGAIPSRAVIKPDPQGPAKVIPAIACKAWRPTAATQRLEELGL